MTATLTDAQRRAVEEWRPVPGYDGWYEVSDQGRVRSWKMPNGRPPGARRAKPVVLRQQRHRFGYLMVTLWKDGAARKDVVHRLVLTSFIGDAPFGHECGHLNSDPTDNRLVNLAWVTAVENHAHKKLRGTTLRGEKSPHAKLTAEKVLEMRAMYSAGGITHACLAKRYGISSAHVSTVINGKRWHHLPLAQERVS